MLNLRTFLFTRARRVVELAASHAPPTLYYPREFADGAGLLSDGSDPGEAYHTLGLYADRVPRVEKPVDLPVFQPNAESRLFDCVLPLAGDRTDQRKIRL